MNIPGYTLMHGATITRVTDGAGNVYIGCCAQRGDEKHTFGFYVFHNGTPLPIAPFCNARGSLNNDGTWIAWTEDGAYFEGPIPGFVPLPRHAALPIPPGSPIAALYHGAYVANDMDTPAEVALRVTKQLEAINQLVALLKTAGVLR